LFVKKSEHVNTFHTLVGSRKNVCFRQAKMVLLLMCQFLKFSSWISTNRWSIPAIYHLHIPRISFPFLHFLANEGLALCQSVLCLDRKSTRLNSSHVSISYAVFCLKKKNNRTCIRLR